MADEHDFPPPSASNGRGNGKSIFKKIESRVRGLEGWQIALLTVGAVVVVDHVIAPKGMSFASKAMDKLGGHKALPLPPPPPIPAPGVTALPAPVAAAVAKGYFAGANNQAGWNRGTSPYGGWALNAPAGPWPYAHAGPGSNWPQGAGGAWANEYPWE